MQMLRQSLFFGVCNYKESLTIFISLITQHLPTKFIKVYSIRASLSTPARKFFAFHASPRKRRVRGF